jgi:hypothetical protein
MLALAFVGVVTLGVANNGVVSAVTTPEPVAFVYQQVTSASQLSRIGSASAVVLSQQLDPTVAVAAVHSVGDRAYLYSEAYWFPAGKTYEGLDIGQNMQWAFCQSGSTPLPGRVDSSGHTWYYLDGNELAARDWWRNYLLSLKSEGWDGIMMDRGQAALHTTMSKLVSSCTGDPVTAGTTFGQSYLALAKLATAVGLKLIFNYGGSPATFNYPTSGISAFLDENPTHQNDYHFADDLTNNQMTENAGMAVDYLISEADTGYDTSWNSVVFAYAKVRLFPGPIYIGTGWNACDGRVVPLCNRFGTYPSLTAAQFGAPLASQPGHRDCVAGSSVDCVWTRRYNRGMSVANVSPQTLRLTLTLAKGKARCDVKNLWRGNVVQSGACITKVSVNLPPWSGRLFTYG